MIQFKQIEDWFQGRKKDPTLKKNQQQVCNQNSSIAKCVQNFSFFVKLLFFKCFFLVWKFQYFIYYFFSVPPLPPPCSSSLDVKNEGHLNQPCCFELKVINTFLEGTKSNSQRSHNIHYHFPHAKFQKFQESQVKWKTTFT